MMFLTSQKKLWGGGGGGGGGERLYPLNHDAFFAGVKITEILYNSSIKFCGLKTRNHFRTKMEFYC